MTESQASFAKRRLAMVLAGGIAGVVVGLAGVYGIATLTRNVGGEAACRPAVELAKKIAPFARGEVAAVNVAKSPLKIPALAFQDAAGNPVTLERWRGRTVLLEFPSYQAALDCYRSDGYQAAAALRKGKAELDLVIIEGYDAPQP